MQAARRSFDIWSASVFTIALILFAPVISLIALSFGDSDGLWAHLFDTVLARYILTTLALMVGVSVVTLVFGVTTAWIVAAYKFRFSRVLDMIILLPIACPAYLVAYAYTDFFEYAGPVQGMLRNLFGWQSPRDYYFPEIRSLGGAVFVLSSVLYPYVYLLARTAFR
ncbi:MAG: ABC transporter permease, partial [Marinovum sp.]|nr:ABC transporter permease [Marinovum sp.]